MHAEKKQIISNGYTRSSDWQELAHRSRETRRKIQPLCPRCSAEIHPTRNGKVGAHAVDASAPTFAPQGSGFPRHSFDTTLRCLSCQAPVEVYQHAEVTETADTRIIYAKVSNGRSRAVVTIELKCLSCEQPLQRDETCTNTCPIQTYLVLEHDDGELYIRRAANLPHVQRDTPDIPIRTPTDTDSHTPETENSVQNSVENSVENSASVTNSSQDAEPENQPLTQENEVPWQSDALTVPEKISEFLIYINEDHTATGTQIKAALGGVAPATFKWAMDTLIEDGKAEKLAYNLYHLRT